jgi:hypothetical protein
MADAHAHAQGTTSCLVVGLICLVAILFSRELFSRELLSRRLLGAPRRCHREP